MEICQGAVTFSLLAGTCLAQNLHRITISAESDGARKACLAQMFHRITISAESDGMKKACLAQTHHRITVSAESDGTKKACLAQTHHPILVSAESDGARKVPFHIGKKQHKVRGFVFSISIGTDSVIRL